MSLLRHSLSLLSHTRTHTRTHTLCVSLYLNLPLSMSLFSLSLPLRLCVFLSIYSPSPSLCFSFSLFPFLYVPLFFSFSPSPSLCLSFYLFSLSFSISESIFLFFPFLPFPFLSISFDNYFSISLSLCLYHLFLLVQKFSSSFFTLYFCLDFNLYFTFTFFSLRLLSTPLYYFVSLSVCLYPPLLSVTSFFFTTLSRNFFQCLFLSLSVSF
jgi:hypothetical protein